MIKIRDLCHSVVVFLFVDIPEDTEADVDSRSNSLQKNSALGYAYNRTFTDNFHQFVEMCLERDPHRRWGKNFKSKIKLHCV